MDISHHSSGFFGALLCPSKFIMWPISMLLHPGQTYRHFLLGMSSKNSEHSRVAAHKNSRLCQHAQAQSTLHRGHSDMKPHPYPRSYWHLIMLGDGASVFFKGVSASRSNNTLSQGHTSTNTGATQTGPDK